MIFECTYIFSRLENVRLEWIPKICIYVPCHNHRHPFIFFFFFLSIFRNKCQNKQIHINLLFYPLLFFIKHELSIDENCWTKFDFFSEDIVQYTEISLGAKNCDQDYKYIICVLLVFIYNTAKFVLRTYGEKNILVNNTG